MRIAMVGAGYAGLVTGVCLAELGHTVTCLDTDTRKIETLRSGGITIFEKDLADYIQRNTAAGRLEFTADSAAAIPGSDLVMIAVGTPQSQRGSSDLSHVHDAAADVAKFLEPGMTIVIKSTVPVGTTAEVAERLASLRPGVDFEIASNPEFLRQGTAVDDFMHPDRIVVGTRTERAANRLRELYQPILDSGAPAVFTNLETSELIKYASNAFLAVKLSFINEMADICEQSGSNVGDLTAALSLDPRIGKHFLSPGPGYGGSCLPKDMQALLHTSRVAGVPSRVVAAAIDVNSARPANMAGKIEAAIGSPVNGKHIAALGLTFKANTDDLRESPAIGIIRSLVGHGARVRVYDPEGMEAARSLISGVEFAENVDECLKGADAVAILTEWSEFASLDLDGIHKLLAEPVVVDLRNLYDPADMEAAGLTYHSIGR
jgi:UDPglucose 6-dehydrogenase